jgi:histidine triad (HIT) family protein
VSDCLFCRMVGGDVPADVVHETDRVFAFRDINPQAPTHVLVIPKDHHATVGALAAADVGLLGEVVSAAHAIAG